MQFAQSIEEVIPLSNLVIISQALRSLHRARKEATRHVDAILVHVCIWLADKILHITISKEETQGSEVIGRSITARYSRPCMVYSILLTSS
jgi:hypothetical protein